MIKEGVQISEGPFRALVLGFAFHYISLRQLDSPGQRLGKSRPGWLDQPMVRFRNVCCDCRQHGIREVGPMTYVVCFFFFNITHCNIIAGGGRGNHVVVHVLERRRDRA